MATGGSLSVKTKGNPASHRMQNKNLKERRAQSWVRGQMRKAARKNAAPKPPKKTWEQRQAERVARRATQRRPADTLAHEAGTPSRYMRAVWEGRRGFDMHKAGIRAGTIGDRRR